MQKAKFWLLAIGAFLVVVALAITGFTDRKGKPEAGSDEQLALARKAKAKLAKQRKELEELDEEFIPENEIDNEKKSTQSENN